MQQFDFFDADAIGKRLTFVLELGVLKARGVRHATEVHQMSIGDRGVEVGGRSRACGGS